MVRRLICGVSFLALFLAVSLPVLAARGGGGHGGGGHGGGGHGGGGHGGGGHGGGGHGGGSRGGGGGAHAGRSFSGGGGHGGSMRAYTGGGGRAPSVRGGSHNFTGGSRGPSNFSRQPQFNSSRNFSRSPAGAGARGGTQQRGGQFVNSHSRPNTHGSHRVASSRAYSPGRHSQSAFINNHFGGVNSSNWNTNRNRASYSNYRGNSWNGGRNHGNNRSYFSGNQSPFRGYYGRSYYRPYGYGGYGYGRYGYNRYGYGGYGRYGYGNGYVNGLLYGVGWRLGAGLWGWPYYLGYRSAWYPYYGSGYGYGSTYGYGGYPYYGYSSYASPTYGYAYSANYAPPATVTAAPAVPADQPAPANDIDPTDFAAKGEAAFQAGNYEMAAREFRHALVDDPGNPGVLMLMAQTAFALGQYDEAAGATQMAMRILPQDKWGEVIVNRQQLYGNSGDYNTQLSRLEKARSDRVDDPAVRFLLGFHYFYLGRTQESLVELDQALKIEPKDPFAGELRNLVATKLGVPTVPVEPVPRQEASPPSGSERSF